MSSSIHLTQKSLQTADLIYIVTSKEELGKTPLNKQEQSSVIAQQEAGVKGILLNDGSKRYHFIFLPENKRGHELLEHCRREGAQLCTVINNYKSGRATIVNLSEHKGVTLAVAEGMTLANYQFLKYIKDKEKIANSLKHVYLDDTSVSEAEVEELNTTLEATMLARDLVNEPLSYLTAEQLGEEIRTLAKKAGFKAEVLTKAKIIALKMGGLLAVNAGSLKPPTFNILEWKPADAKNEKPIILVGKGVVFDTGGLSLKPTPNSMDLMKSDMAGAAAVAGVIYALAKMGIPLYVIGLIPATENRPGGDAYAPGDVIRMYDGTSVEVLNTDAEGRLILADALAYAKKFNPRLVIDVATLTGAAARAVGKEAIVYMSTAEERLNQMLEESGWRTYERLVRFPLWDEYGEYLKSDIADLKNVGGPTAGAITAAKFLQHFTAYPWIHMDIAGTAFLTSQDSYKGKNATGAGVRLLIDYLKNFTADGK